MKKRILAIMAYVLPTFPIGYFWYLTLFAEYYKSLDIYPFNLQRWLFHWRGVS